MSVRHIQGHHTKANIPETQWLHRYPQAAVACPAFRGWPHESLCCRRERCEMGSRRLQHRAHR